MGVFSIAWNRPVSPSDGAPSAASAGVLEWSQPRAFGGIGSFGATTRGSADRTCGVVLLSCQPLVGGGIGAVAVPEAAAAWPWADEDATTPMPPETAIAAAMVIAATLDVRLIDPILKSSMEASFLFDSALLVDVRGLPNADTVLI